MPGQDSIKKQVQERYGKIAAKNGSCCCSSAASCCGSSAGDMSRKLGYNQDDLDGIPQGADLGLGCGNPTAFASLKEGETVLDLGSGAGIDCFIAAKKVGRTGRVIGVDMTPEMLARARENAAKGNYGNVEFRLGEIERLPVADSSVDAIISNCVINLSPDKEQVFREVFRVLKPGGRLMVSDIVLLRKLPDNIERSIEAYAACVAGAVMKEAYLGMIRSAGFTGITVAEEPTAAIEHAVGDEGDLLSSISSIRVSAVKPAAVTAGSTIPGDIR